MPLLEIAESLRCGSATRKTFQEGIFSPTTKEVSKSFLEVSQSLLQRYTANLVQKLQVFLLFPLGKHGRSFGIVNALLSFIPGFRSQGGSAGEASPADTPRCERSVIDQPHTSHRPTQEGFLFGRWVKAISERLFGHSHIIAQIL